MTLKEKTGLIYYMAFEKKSKFGLGLILGSIVGGITALFFTPKTGKEMREIAKKWLMEEVEKLKKEATKFDKRKFKKAVEKVLGRIKKEMKKEGKELQKVKKHLLSQWDKIKKEK